MNGIANYEGGVIPMNPLQSVPGTIILGFVLAVILSLIL